MNVVFIMTDTQHVSLVGAYGHPAVDTPNLDRLAASGTRYDACFTTCPLCTPARAALFSGLYAPVSGAWANNIAPQAGVPLLGEMVRRSGLRAAYSGKWHLDGGGYFGDGQAGGGFEEDWWFDGANWAREVGPAAFAAYKRGDWAGLRAAGVSESGLWGTRVCDRAIDFLTSVGDADFCLVASFDEPHGPYVCPADWWERAPVDALPEPVNYRAPLDGKPAQQRVHAAEVSGRLPERYADYRPQRRRYLGCNAWIDRQIGRLIEAVERLHGDDTMIIYTSDHGSMDGAHGLLEKGPMQYDEVVRVPLIIRRPGQEPQVVREPVSHIDLLPTVLDGLGIDRPDCLHGRSLLTEGTARACAFHGFDRFAINHDGWGGFSPVRAASDGRHTLVLNLLDDRDEFYDRQEDPGQCRNLIDEPHAVRDRLHDAILEEMDRCRDPMRCWQWGARPWRQVRRPSYHHGAQRRERPRGFPWEAAAIGAD